MKKTTMNSKKLRAKALAVVLGLAACFSVTGISAYFTDGASASNTFTVGKISLELLEPDWNENNAKNILPEQEIAKDPQIKNNGINDEFVFLEVVLPYANVKTANDNGAVNAAADTQLFTYDINSTDWVQVGDAVKNTEEKTITYVYAYARGGAMTALKKDAVTSSLFEYVRFANVAAGQSLSETLEMVIHAYGIQTTNLHDADTTIDGANGDGKVAPADVWAVIGAERA